MTTILPKCDHCKQDKYPRQLQSDGRGGMICDTCAKKDHGEGHRLERRKGLGVLNG